MRIALAAAVAIAHVSLAQLRADRLYCTVNRPIPATVEAQASKGRLEVVLAEFDGREISRVPVLPGQIDLAPLFPTLWTDMPRRVLKAQLLVAGEPVGAPLILQPLLAPSVATLDGRADPKRPVVVFKQPEKVEDVYSGLRVYGESRVEMVTDVGTILIALRPDAAPNTAFNFRALVAGGFYTDVTFHRVVPRGRDGEPFVIQGGDPTGGGEGGPGYAFDLEPSTLKHDLGVVSMARTPDPNSNGSQFFICLSRAGTARLDGSYCAFAQVVEGIEAVKAIASTTLQPGTDKPVKPPVIKEARLIDAPATKILPPGPDPSLKLDPKSLRDAAEPVKR